MVYRLRKNLETESGICTTRSGLVLHWSECSLAFENAPPWETQSRRTRPKGTGSKRRESGHRRYHRSHKQNIRTGGRRRLQTPTLDRQSNWRKITFTGGSQTQIRASRRRRFPRCAFSSRSTPLLLVRKRSISTRTPGNTAVGDDETFGPVKLSS